MMEPVECGNCKKDVMPVVQNGDGHRCPRCGEEIDEEKLDDVL